MKDFQFSLKKRFFFRITFNEFIDVARRLIEMIQETRPSTSVVLTCEDANIHTPSYAPDKVMFLLQNRKSYTLDQLTVQVWERSLHIVLIIKDHSDSESFVNSPMVCLTCDRRRDAGSIKFYGQDIDQKTHEMVLGTFAKPSIVFKIGDGYRKGTKYW